MKVLSRILTLGVLFLAAPAGSWAGVELKGVSSAMTSPLFSSWMNGFAAGQTGVKVKLENKTSSDSVEQWLGRGALFAAIDTPLTLAEENWAKVRVPLDLPVALEAIVITYNLPGIPAGIKLTPKILSAIFMGNIRKWNDPVLTEMNPGVHLPDLDILVLYRDDTRSVRDLFPNIISRLDSNWTQNREKEKNLHWPVGRKVRGNEQAEEFLRKYPGSIAALDFQYAMTKNLPAASVKNESGEFILPTVESIQAATADIAHFPDDFKVWINHSRDHQAYPLCGFMWMMVYQDNHKVFHDPKREKALLDFLDYIVGEEGQKLAKDPGFLPLPDGLLVQVKDKIKSLHP